MPLEYREADELGDRVYTIEPGTYTFFRTRRGQTIELFSNAQHGRMIFIDSMLQSAERDEEFYHTSLLAGTEKKGRCLVLGGGEGAVLRELIRRDPTCGAAITDITMVDWDEDFVQHMRQKEPHWSGGAFDDPRVSLIFTDAWEWCRRGAIKGPYQIIVVDLFDPEFRGQADILQWSELYRILAAHLADDGVLVLNGGRDLPYDHGRRHCLQNILAEYFPRHECELRSVYIPSFGSTWTLGCVRPPPRWPKTSKKEERAEGEFET
jgi:spermidine synthase